MLPAWRTIVDFYACPVVKGLVPDGGDVVMVEGPTVWVTFQMACRGNDMVVEIPKGLTSGAIGCRMVFIR